jgi:diguanylate cyclase (GGDEF)-like protein
MRRRETSGIEITPQSRDLEDTVRQLKRQLRSLKEEAAKNEVILRKTQERELELLRAESLPDLLHGLVRGLRESYALDAVTLILRDPQHDVRHLLIGDCHRLEEFPEVMFVDALGERSPVLADLNMPWLGPYAASEHSRLFPSGRSLHSVALIPLIRQSRATGALSFGSSDPRRFTRQHGTDFLSHLGVVAAVCIENAVNRARLLRSGLTDFLTGWHNRRYLQTRIREELARAQRSGSSVACLLIDVDRFKQINDTHGHLGGDQILREIARRIETHIRVSDTAARFGGDEFAILLPETSGSEAAKLAERIRQTVGEAPIALGEGRDHTVSLSIGVAAVQPGRDTRDLKALADHLLAEADTRLYRAKALGRDQIAAS